MASRIVTFKLNEKTVVEDYLVKQGIYNGFGKILDLPPIRYVRKKPIGFSPKELGELLIQMGNELKTVRHNITDVKITSGLTDSVFDNRQQLVLEISYEETENN